MLSGKEVSCPLAVKIADEEDSRQSRNLKAKQEPNRLLIYYDQVVGTFGLTVNLLTERM
jgi:hypothetical protein